MGADNALRASQAIQGLESKDAWARRFRGRYFLPPQMSHHQLEIRRFDASVPRHGIRSAVTPAAHLAQRDAAHSYLIEYRLHEGWFDRGLEGVIFGKHAVVLGDGAFDGGATGGAAQVLDSKVVVEQARDPALEPVQLGKRILANADEEARPQVPAGNRARELVSKRSPAIFLRVIEKVVLELIEDDDQVGLHTVGPFPQRREQRGR